MLGRVRKSGSTLDKARQGRLEVCRKAGVLLAKMGLVEGVIEDIQKMQALALRRRLPGCSGGGQGGRVRVGQGEQILGHGCDAGARVG